MPSSGKPGRPPSKKSSRPARKNPDSASIPDETPTVPDDGSSTMPETEPSVAELFRSAGLVYLRVEHAPTAPAPDEAASTDVDHPQSGVEDPDEDVRGDDDDIDDASTDAATRHPDPVGARAAIVSTDARTSKTTGGSQGGVLPATRWLGVRSRATPREEPPARPQQAESATSDEKAPPAAAVREPAAPPVAAVEAPEKSAASPAEPDAPARPSEARTRVRLALLAAAVAAAVAAVALPTLPIRGISGATATSAAGAGEAATTWLTANAEPTDRIAVPPELRASLIDAGWDPADVAAELGADVAWAVTPASDGSADSASVAIARFGSGGTALDVRAVVADPDAYRADAAARAEERRTAGAEIAQNPGVTVPESDRALLTDGSVDSRILTVLGALAAAGSVTVAAFPAIDGEADEPRRTLVLSSVGDAAVARGGELTPAGIAVVRGLTADYTPDRVAVRGDELRLRFPVAVEALEKGTAP